MKVETSRGSIITENLVPGKRVYGEELFKRGEKEFRVWDYYRSKPAAALKKGLENFPIEKGDKILYLGVASGTTVSHFSDLVGREGIIYGIEISERVLRELVPVADARGNIVPVLGDARKPETYGNIIMEKMDVVYEDVADPDQINILIRNCDYYLRPGGYAMIAIKSQSIDVTLSPQKVYQKSLEELEKHFEVVESIELDPYEKHHLYVVLRKRNPRK